MKNAELKGQKAQEYADAKANAACLKKRLEDIGENLVSLGQALQNSLKTVRISGQYIDLRSHIIVSVGEARLNRTERVPSEILSSEHFQHLLEQYLEAEALKARLEKDLRQIGLGPLLEPD